MESRTWFKQNYFASIIPLQKYSVERTISCTIITKIVDRILTKLCSLLPQDTKTDMFVKLYLLKSIVGLSFYPIRRVRHTVEAEDSP